MLARDYNGFAQARWTEAKRGSEAGAKLAVLSVQGAGFGFVRNRFRMLFELTVSLGTAVV